MIRLEAQGKVIISSMGQFDLIFDKTGATLDDMRDLLLRSEIALNSMGPITLENGERVAFRLHLNMGG